MIALKRVLLGAAIEAFAMQAAACKSLSLYRVGDRLDQSMYGTNARLAALMLSVPFFLGGTFANV